MLVLFGLHARLIPIKPISFYRRGVSNSNTSERRVGDSPNTQERGISKSNTSERRVDDSPNTQERGVSNNNAKGMPRSLSNAGDSRQAEGNVSPEINGSLSQLPRVAERKMENFEQRDNVKKPKTGTPADVNPSESASCLEIAHTGRFSSENSAERNEKKSPNCVAHLEKIVHTDGFSIANSAARNEKKSPDCVAHLEKDVSSCLQSLRKEADRLGEKPEADEYIQAILATAISMQPNGPNNCGFIEYAEKKSDAILLGVAILMNLDPQGFGVTGGYATALLNEILGTINISKWKAPGSKEKQDLLDVFSCFEVGMEKQRGRIIELQEMVKNSIEGQAGTITRSVCRSLDAQLESVTAVNAMYRHNPAPQHVSTIIGSDEVPWMSVKPNFMVRDSRHGQDPYQVGSDLSTRKIDCFEDIDLEEGNDKPEYGISSKNDRPIFPIFDYFHKLIYMGEGSAQQPLGAFWSLWSSTPSDLMADELEAGLSNDGPDHRAVHNRKSRF